MKGDLQHRDTVRRVAVGMSGGLDSSVTAALLVEAGHEVLGLTLRLFKQGSRCCSLEDIARSRKVCDHLGVHHYPVNAIDLFQDRIVRPFIETYSRGKTPSPCVMCNQYVKFGALHARALELGCSHVATGHYVRTAFRDGRWRLLRATDRAKDQSYFLHRLSQAQLGRSLFPLHAWSKPEAAAYAAAHGLPVETSSKAESQDLCFVPESGHAGFLEEHRPELRREGDIVDTEGRVLGRHRGFHAYTIGQRQGLGVAAPHRLYVRALDPDRNRVEVGTREQVEGTGCTVEDMHWIAGEPPDSTLEAAVQIRYRHRPAPARLRVLADGRVSVYFDEPQFAVTPGQAAAVYHEDEVLGGGWIAREPSADADAT